MAAGAGFKVLHAEAAEPAKRGPVEALLTRDLDGVDGKETTVLTVDFAPGAAGPPHRHDAQVFVYVLEGSVRMQVQGSPPVVLTVGQTFYEGPNDIHVVSANASQTQRARILVFMIKTKGAPLTTEVKMP
jgi:quercetin dioxygenase-like cupin family protein